MCGMIVKFETAIPSCTRTSSAPSVQINVPSRLYSANTEGVVNDHIGSVVQGSKGEADLLVP
jgi:hypothetical protein